MRGATLVSAVLSLTLFGCGDPPTRLRGRRRRRFSQSRCPTSSRADEAVQVQARERHTALLEKIKAGVQGPELGTAYGELGMLLQAAEHPEAAEPCYRNAQAVMPADARWPYLPRTSLPDHRPRSRIRGGVRARAGAAAG